MNEDLDPNWIRADEFSRKHNVRTNTIQKRLHDGVWERGVIYATPSGSVGYIHEARALAWMKEHG